MDENRIEEAIRSRVARFERGLREAVKEWTKSISEDQMEEETDRMLLNSIEMWYVE